MEDHAEQAAFRVGVDGEGEHRGRLNDAGDHSLDLARGARAVASLNALVPRPDVTVVTGDLVDHGEPNEYEQLRHLLAPLSMPVFVIPGNHDAREPLREAFRDARYLPAEGYLQFAIEDCPVLRLVALDTLVSG